MERPPALRYCKEWCTHWYSSKTLGYMAALSTSRLLMAVPMCFSRSRASRAEKSVGGSEAPAGREGGREAGGGQAGAFRSGAWVRATSVM